MIKTKQAKKRSSAVSSVLNSVTSAIAKDNLLISLEKSNLKIKVANNETSKKKVFELAYQVYQEKGYSQNQQSKMESLPLDSALDTLIVFVENEKDEVVGSITIYNDSLNLLPADTIFNQELNELRNHNLKFGEVTRFVIRNDYQNQKEILIRLMNVLLIYNSRLLLNDEVIIEVNPRHADYYQKLLGFECYGEIKECPRVNNAPAVLMRCSMNKYKDSVDLGIFPSKSLYQFFLPKEKEINILEGLKSIQSKRANTF